MANKLGGRPPGTAMRVANALGEDVTYVRQLASKMMRGGRLPRTVQAHRVMAAYIADKQAELERLTGSIKAEAATDPCTTQPCSPA